MALGSTQPLTEMSTRNLPGGKGLMRSSYRLCVCVCVCVSSLNNFCTLVPIFTKLDMKTVHYEALSTEYNFTDLIRYIHILSRERVTIRQDLDW
jgi:hypothetical protein